MKIIGPVRHISVVTLGEDDAEYGGRIIRGMATEFSGRDIGEAAYAT